jgi:hypothetical protein
LNVASAVVKTMVNMGSVTGIANVAVPDPSVVSPPCTAETPGAGPENDPPALTPSPAKRGFVRDCDTAALHEPRPERIR